MPSFVRSSNRSPCDRLNGDSAGALRMLFQPPRYGTRFDGSDSLSRLVPLLGSDFATCALLVWRWPFIAPSIRFQNEGSPVIANLRLAPV